MDKTAGITDDWTQNWQRRIAVRITSIVLWSLCFLSLSVLAFFLSSMQKEVVNAHQATLERIAFHALKQINQSGVWRDTQIYDSIPHNRLSDFSSLAVSSSRGAVMVGEPSSADVQTTLTVQFFWRDGSEDELTMTGFHLSQEQTVRRRQVELVMMVSGTILLFGLALAWVINKNVRQPFETLISATKDFSQGAKDVRVNLRRADEFGVLAEFFNAMLDRVRANEADLTREVTQKHAALKALQENKDHLQEIVKLRTEALKVAHDQAMAANQAKSAFLANMSHEIRTPLTAIIGFAEMLKDDSTPIQIKENAVETVIRSGKHLLSIIDDVLDLSKIEANKLAIEILPVDLFQLLSDLDAVVEIQAQHKSLHFAVIPHFPLPTTVYIDPTRLKQILLNLCSNALKFTSNGGVKVEITHLPDKGLLQISVIDSGIGLRTDQVDKLFKPFGQADSSTSRRYGGTGLGLHISKQLAEMMGGTIRVDSAYGVGSRFEVTVATGDLADVEFIRDAEHIPKKSTPNVFTGIPKLRGRVLLAEDNIDNQNLISLLIRKTGLQVDIVGNGERALLTAQTTAFDLLLMDIQMPIMDGMKATKALRRKNYHGPIVALTANVMKDDIKRYRSIGFTDHLSKPIEKIAFFAALAKYCPAEPLDERSDAEDNANAFDAATAPLQTNPMLDDPDFAPLVQRFLAHLPKMLSDLDSAIEQQDWPQAGEYVHVINGTAGNFGYKTLTQLAAQLGNLIKKKNTSAVISCHHSLNRLAKRILDQEES